MKLRFAPLAAAAALCFAPLAAQAVVYTFNASLNGANEKPTAVGTSATGLATLSYNDMGTIGTGDDTYSFSLFASGFNGGGTPTLAHIHASATTAETAPARVDLLAPPFANLVAPGFLLVGAAGVTPPPTIPVTGVHPAMSFLAALQGGLAYVNVHTAAHGGGEIRGQLIQVTAVPEPATYGMLALGLAGIGFAARRRNRG